MTSPVLQVKRGALSNLPGLRAGEPAFTTDSFDFYVGINSTTGGNKFLGSYRYWTKETSSTGSSVKLVEGTTNGSNYVALKAPDIIASDVTYTLPGTQGASQTVLTNDGSGGLSWSSGSNNATFTGITTFTDTTDNTLGNPDTGAVQIDGGVGINKNVSIGEGLDVQGSVNIGQNINVAGFSTFYQLSILDNGMNVQGFSTIYHLDVTTDLFAGGTITFDGVLLADNDVRILGITTVTNTTDSVNYSTGAIVTNGGLGVNKSVNIGQNLNVLGISTVNTLNVNGAATFNSTITGTISNATYAANAGISTQVKVGSAGNNNATYYLTFVNNNNGSPTASNVYTDDGVYYNPGSNTFTTQYATFTGEVTAQSGLNVTSGVTTVGTLNVSGPATFTNTITGTISTATRATSVDVAGVATNQDYYITLVDAAGNAKAVGVDAELLYNPNTNKMKVPTINVGTLNASDGTNAINISNTTGAVGFANSVTVNGDLYVIGNTTQVETTNLKVQDNLIDLGLTQSNGVLVPPGSDLNIDLGILMNWYNGSSKKAAVYWHDSTQRLTLASDVTESAGVLTANTYADIEIGSLWVNDCAGQSQVVSCTGSERFLNNITVDAGTF